MKRARSGKVFQTFYTLLFTSVFFAPLVAKSQACRPFTKASVDRVKKALKQSTERSRDVEKLISKYTPSEGSDRLAVSKLTEQSRVNGNSLKDMDEKILGPAIKRGEKEAKRFSCRCAKTQSERTQCQRYQRLAEGEINKTKDQQQGIQGARQHAQALTKRVADGGTKIAVSTAIGCATGGALGCAIGAGTSIAEEANDVAGKTAFYADAGRDLAVAGAGGYAGASRGLVGTTAGAWKTGKWSLVGLAGGALADRTVSPWISKFADNALKRWYGFAIRPKCVLPADQTLTDEQKKNICDQQNLQAAVNVCDQPGIHSIPKLAADCRELNLAIGHEDLAAQQAIEEHKNELITGGKVHKDEFSSYGE